jgi:hypothetical protein
MTTDYARQKLFEKTKGSNRRELLLVYTAEYAQAVKAAIFVLSALAARHTRSAANEGIALFHDARKCGGFIGWGGLG